MSVALVDADDYEQLSRIKWDALCGYVKGNDEGRQVFMHRMILTATAGMVVDHANGDTLDNRRCNLRVATQQENSRNHKKHQFGRNPYKGVYSNNGGKTWFMSIFVNGKPIRVKGFRDPAIAAKAYDSAAKEHFGEFARLNFPE